MKLIEEFVKNKVYHRLVESEEFVIPYDEHNELHYSYNGLFNRYERTPRGFVIRFTTVSDEYIINKNSDIKSPLESVVNIYAIEIYKTSSTSAGKIYLENTSESSNRVLMSESEICDVRLDDNTLTFREQMTSSDMDLQYNRIALNSGILTVEYCGNCIEKFPRNIASNTAIAARDVIKFMSR